jgi:hypothetical protein
VGAVAEGWQLLAVPLGQCAGRAFVEGFVFPKKNGASRRGRWGRVNFLQTKMVAGTPLLKAATFAPSNEREV